MAEGGEELDMEDAQRGAIDTQDRDRGLPDAELTQPRSGRQPTVVDGVEGFREKPPISTISRDHLRIKYMHT